MAAQSKDRLGILEQLLDLGTLRSPGFGGDSSDGSGAATTGWVMLQRAELGPQVDGRGSRSVRRKLPAAKGSPAHVGGLGCFLLRASQKRCLARWPL